MCWSPDGASLASGSEDGTIKIFNTKTGKCDSTLSGHSGYVTADSYSCSFSNVWCVLTIEYCTGLSGVFASVQTANRLLMEAGTKP